MDRLFSYLPDASLRTPLTLKAIAPVVSCYYAHAVMAILPGTFWFRVSLIPVTLWLAWHSAVTLDIAQYLADTLGLAANSMRISHLNFMFVLSMWAIALKSFEWTFLIKEPVRRYEVPKDGEPLKERPLTILNQILKLLVKVAALDASHYIIQLLRPSTYRLEGDTIFDETLSLGPRLFQVSCISLCGMVVIYTSVDIMYQLCALSASQWPRIANRPWLSMSVTEFWGKRWHQFFRHIFVVYGSRPGGKVAGWYGSIIGAYVVTAIMHVLGLWGLGRGTEFTHTGGFFIMIGLASVFERQWKLWTGKPVTGLSGTVWAMVWQLIWGSGMVDSWARRGMVANDFIRKDIRIGKVLVDFILTVVSRIRAV
ncbi:hypothetical protein B0F90DRAFT_1811747 [Multifurca ochricompacta]|uniref:Wax synthase domain-containing protein n=1 Tax=Multifurca ochricompacta TaxID=376703 RepID=A0AAD4LXU8_9AGAM|nr:hypothetical protein B0F90DRAFT_1811747 [Multifurca ochricompacta]